MLDVLEEREGVLLSIEPDEEFDDKVVAYLTTESNGTTTNPTGQALLIQEDAYGYLEQLGKIQYIDGSTGNMSETFQGALLWGSGYLLPKNVVACTCSYTLGLPANTEVSFDI